jgi:hypothetical protein
MRKEEYIYLYTVFTGHDEALLNRENIIYFTSEVAENLFLIALSLKQASIKIALDSAAALIMQLFQKERQRAELLDMLKKIYADDDTVLGMSVDDDLKSSYRTMMIAEQTEKLLAARTDNEIIKINEVYAAKFQPVCDIKDVQTIGDCYNDYINEQTPIFKSLKLYNLHLTDIFGKDIKSQLYSLSGIPGGYKTAFVTILELELLKNGYTGLHIGFEDSNKYTFAKICNIKTGFDQNEIISKNINVDALGKCLNDIKDRGFICDRSRTAEEIYQLIIKMILKHGIDFVIIDFVQMIKLKKGQTELEAINELMYFLQDVIKLHNIAIIILNQVPAAEIREVSEGKKKLRMGVEKGSGNIIQNARYAYYLTPIAKDENNNDIVEIYCGKDSMNGKRGAGWEMVINGASKEIIKLTGGFSNGQNY